MKRKPFIFFVALALTAALGLTGCSRTIDDVANWKAKGNVEKLLKALDDPKIEVRLAATEALGELKAAAAVDSLAALYNDPEESIIRAAVQSLAQIGTPSTITPLIAALKLDYPESRLTAAVTLGNLKATGAVNALGEALGDSESDVQLAAAVSLGQIGDEGGSAALAGKLVVDSVELRKACAESLGMTGGEVAAESLVDVMGDSNGGVRDAAADSLIKLQETAVPYAREALRHVKKNVRAGALKVLRGVDAIPDAGPDLIWYVLARISVDSKEGIDTGVIGQLTKMGDDAIDTLLEAAALSIPDFREHASLSLERIGLSAADKAVAAAEKSASGTAKEWFNKRSKWHGAPSWRIDLWAAVTALNPDFELDKATRSSLEMMGRPAFNIIIPPTFTASRETTPYLIDLLGDTTTPPPEEPDYDADGIPIIKQKRDLFRGEANQQIAEEKLAAAGYLSTFPLIAAIEDANEHVAGHAANILGDQKEKRALKPMIHVFSKKIEAGEYLTESPFYRALQKMDDPAAEPLLQKVRPNADRAMRVFERKYTGVRAMSAETEDSTGHSSQPITFRVGYIDSGKVSEFEFTFMKDGSGDWTPTPPLPEEL